MINASDSNKAHQIEWRIDDRPILYPDAISFMENRVAAIRAGKAPEMVWLLEHPPLYTAGTSARPQDLLDPNRFPVFQTGRGGQYTYHGPGQRVAYVMLDLKRWGTDIRCYVHQLEEWAIRTLAHFNIRGERRPGRVGIWVPRSDGGEDKIAAIGVRVRQWVTFHGMALNLDPALDHFSGIVPCGIGEARYGVTSLHKLGFLISMQELDMALRQNFNEVFADQAPTCAPK